MDNMFIIVPREGPHLLTRFDEKDLAIYRKAVAIYGDPDLQVEKTYREFKNYLGLWDYSPVYVIRSPFWNLFEELKKLEKIAEE